MLICTTTSLPAAAEQWRSPICTACTDEKPSSNVRPSVLVALGSNSRQTLLAASTAGTRTSMTKKV